MSISTYKTLNTYINRILRCPESNPKQYSRIDKELINGSSIDVRIGRVIHREDSIGTRVVDLAAKESPPMTRFELDWDEQFTLAPQEFILAQTVEEFYLPTHLSAEFRLKSSPARSGLDQALAVWCDPGWTGSVLTLELRNNLRYNHLSLTVGMKIGQIVFHEGEAVPDHASYATRGQYNGDKEATENKGVR